MTAHIQGVDNNHETVFAWSWQKETTYYVVVANYAAHQSEVIVASPWQEVDFSIMSMTVAFSNASEDSAIVPISHGIECRLQPYEAIVITVRTSA